MSPHHTLYIGGRWVQPHASATIEVENPTDTLTLGTVPDASPTDVDRAVAAAISEGYAR